MVVCGTDLYSRRCQGGIKNIVCSMDAAWCQQTTADVQYPILATIDHYVWKGA